MSWEPALPPTLSSSIQHFSGPVMYSLRFGCGQLLLGRGWQLKSQLITILKHFTTCQNRDLTDGAVLEVSSKML